MNSRKKFFPLRVVSVSLWHRLPREALAASPLEVSKVSLDKA